MNAPFQLLVTYRRADTIRQQRYNCTTLSQLIARRDGLAKEPDVRAIETLVVIEQWSKSQ